MKIKWNNLAFFVAVMGLIFTACRSEKTFQVKGNFTSADKDTLYLEHRGIGGVEIIDSVVLKDNGTFTFKHPAPENPEFYQLRLGNQVVAFAVDSVETLQVKADAKDFYRTFTVEDSPTNDLIRQVDALTQSATTTINDLEKKHEAKVVDDVAFINELDSALNNYKTQVSKIILANPSSAAAYYAAFQKINDYLIFDPYTRQDYAMFGAVATSWSRYYPETPRTKHLYDFTMNALRTRKQQEQQEKLLESVPVITDSALPDITLADVSGQRVSLSSLQGKVVLLDFTVYNSEFSPKHNIDLNALYNQHKSKGFEIYQISLDSDDHFWKNAANNLPWITVRDPQSVYSRLLSTYNVRELPTAFIINRSGDIVARIENYTQLNNELSKAL